ncbi:MAG: protein-L-isoaspartate(D-aspartate) O-methyltransferase, partial [Pseudomonadota bacterium]
LRLGSSIPYPFIAYNTMDKIYSLRKMLFFKRQQHLIVLSILLLILFFSIATHLRKAYGAENIDQYATMRQFMVEKHLKARDIDDKTVLNSMGTVPREKFVLEKDKDIAYIDSAIPIDYGQAISQPSLVALMTQLLEPKKDHIALEIGTGTGYQAAVLAEIVDRVYTIEIIPQLGKSAAKRLHALGYNNITVKIADGYYGWKEYAPFDCIVVTAAASHLPPPLIKQLKRGGKMVIPVGLPFLPQHLVLVKKSLDGDVHTRNVIGVMFVPFVREINNNSKQ